MVDGTPKVAELAVGLHKHLVQVPAPLRIAAHVRDASLTDLGGEHGPNRFHQNRTVSWLMSIPRSVKRSSTLRSDSGYRTYIITTRRMTSGELLKYWNRLFRLVSTTQRDALRALCLTTPCGGILRGAPTPRIDQLAAETRLADFNVEAQCTPSRSALMTGRFPIRSGTQSVPVGDEFDGLTRWDVTIANSLSAAGYATGAFGKWHLGSVQERLPNAAASTSGMAFHAP